MNMHTVNIWKDHFKRVLGGGDTDGVALDGGEGSSLDFSDRLFNLYISKEEVRSVLNKMKKDASPGQDWVVMDMLVVDVLFDVWVSLFEVCWEYGLVRTCTL